VVAAGGARRASVRHAGQNELLAPELKFLTGFAKVRLPRGAIHGDLFCDNVLFAGERVSGSSTSASRPRMRSPTDLAITVNDWCVDKTGSGALVPELVSALAAAYDAVRSLTPDERAQWPALLRAAALRFWLSRLYDLHLPRPASSCTRTTRRTSSGSCAIGSTNTCRCRKAPRSRRQVPRRGVARREIE
jgi:homoserine kinase type II